jgi:hypothetical protein
MKKSWSSLTVVALLTLQGCYVYTPLYTSAPPTGESVVLNISDRGRVALAERLGPGVISVKGRVATVAEEQMSINVSAVGYISGENSLWSGESMSLSREYVSNVQVRKLSKSRTWMTVGVTAVAVGTLIATRGLLVGFFGLDNGNDPGCDPNCPTSLRLNLGFRF